MKSNTYTTDLSIEIDFGNQDQDDWREFTLILTADWENDGIGRYEYGSAVCFDKGTDYLSEIIDWSIEEKVSSDEYAAIEKYINDNKNDILSRMADEYDPFWNCPY